MNCHCTPEEVLAGHRPDCPLNKELAPKPIPPRKPFEEMDRDEMIMAHTHLRASIAEYVTGLHIVGEAADRLLRVLDSYPDLQAPINDAAHGLKVAMDYYKPQRGK